MLTREQKIGHSIFVEPNQISCQRKEECAQSKAASSLLECRQKLADMATDAGGRTDQATMHEMATSMASTLLEYAEHNPIKELKNTYAPDSVRHKAAKDEDANANHNVMESEKMEPCTKVINGRKFDINGEVISFHKRLRYRNF